MMYERIALAILLTGLTGQASTGLAGHIEYEIVATFGVEESDPLIPQPTLISATGDGGPFFVYSASTCRVHVLDADLREIHQFGRCGEGPGDLSGVLAIHREADELRVIMSHRIARHALDGTYLGEVSLADRPLGSPIVIVGDRILAVAYPRFDRLVLLDPSSETEPKVVLDEGGRDVLRSMGTRKGIAYFYGSRSGSLFRVDLETFRSERISIGLESAEVDTRASGSGSASYWQSPISAAWVDDSGIYVATRSENAERWKQRASSPDADAAAIQYVVRRYDDSLHEHRLVQFRPVGWPLLGVVSVGTGMLVVLDRWGSRGALLRATNVPEKHEE